MIFCSQRRVGVLLSLLLMFLELRTKLLMLSLVSVSVGSTSRVLAICYPQLLRHCSRVKYRIALGLHRGFWCCSHSQLHSFDKCVVCFLHNCCAWCLGSLESEVPFHPCSLAPPFPSTKGDSGRLGATRRVAMDNLLLMLEHCPAPPTL